MPFIIGPVEPIDRETLIRYLKDGWVQCEHMVEGGSSIWFHDIEYVDKNIKKGDHIYIAEGRYGHKYVWDP